MQQTAKDRKMEIEASPQKQANKTVFDYQKCFFECRIYKKKILNSQQQYCYISDDFIALCDEPYKKNPDRIIELNNEVKVEWVYNRQQTPPHLKSFIFKRVGEEIEYTADKEVLKMLQDVFRKKIFQARFQDQYDVIRQIGKGNYARVYAVKNRYTGEKFAVKCFEKKKLEGVDKGILSLYNEMKIMRTLYDHPNVIKLYETFEGENTYYLVMEIVEGASLYDEMKKHIYKEFTEQEIYNIMKMLVEAVAFMAKNNVMHRDLKLENILFAQRGVFSELKIVDFGLATVCDEAPYIFPKCGTPGFVAPEIANLVDKQKGYDKICDMFSIGVIFHILLTGEAVFKGKKFNEVLQKNKECEIKFEGSAYDFLHRDTIDLLSKMLKKEPEQRISAEDALKHPYFQQKFYKGQLKTNNVMGTNLGGNAGSATELDTHHDKPEKIPEIRPKKASVFTKPQKIPYIRKEEAVDPKHEDFSSFVTKEPMWAGEKQNEFRQQQQFNQIPQMPDNAYYTVGSFDQQVKQFANGQNISPLQFNQQQQQINQSPGTQHYSNQQQQQMVIGQSPLQAKPNSELENISNFVINKQSSNPQPEGILPNNNGNIGGEILTQQIVRKTSSIGSVGQDRIKKNSINEPIIEEKREEEDQEGKK